jgi:hypothetical protein
MTDSDRILQPVEVTVKNWPDPPAKQPLVKNSTIRTVLLAAGADGTVVQISDYEPKRIRMVLYVLDSPIGMSDSPPTTSPDASTSTSKPASGGGVLPNSTNPYEFFGPDAWWINQLGMATRVTILKEFC